MAKPGFADAHGIRKHGLEHRLQLAGRARDDAEDLRGRRLSFQSLRQLARARLHLLEQPRVLDGDDGLVGEGLKEFDVARGKGAGFRSGDDNRSDGLAIAEHRYRQLAPPAASECKLPDVQWISKAVLDLRYGSIEDRPTRDLVGQRRP